MVALITSQFTQQQLAVMQFTQNITWNVCGSCVLLFIGAIQKLSGNPLAIGLGFIIVVSYQSSSQPLHSIPVTGPEKTNHHAALLNWEIIITWIRSTVYKLQHDTKNTVIAHSYQKLRSTNWLLIHVGHL